MEIDERFLKKGMTLLVDGFTAPEIRTLLEVDMILSEQEADNDAKVFEAAGGYAPTIGIIGAVLGLMQVMKHLDNIQEVGRGIAVAFVATVYGVGIANLDLSSHGQQNSDANTPGRPNPRNDYRSHSCYSGRKKPARLAPVA